MIIKKLFKKFALILLCAVTAACGAAALLSCKKSDDEETGKKQYGKWDSFDGVKVAFVDEEAYNRGDIDESKILPELNCKLNQNYYIVVDFEIQAPHDNDGSESVTASVQIAPAASVSATIQETETGNVDESTANDIKTIKATFKIPGSAETVRSVRLVIRFVSIKTGLAHIDFAFEGSEEMQAVKTDKIKKSAVMGYTDGLTFKYGDDGYVVTGGAQYNSTIIIPNIYNGYAVTGIGAQAFSRYENLKEVVLPSTVMIIGEGAFEYCSALKSINIPDSVTKVSKNAFNGCSALFKKSDGVSYADKWAIGYESGITEATLSSGTVGIADYAFTGSKITKIIIPNSVKSIGEGAFDGCRQIWYVKIPEGVTSIGDYTFRGCSVLEDITVPKGVKYIGKAAFSGCSGLRSAFIPTSVADIGEDAFNGCSGLTKINLFNGVVSIGNGAFTYCSGLSEITMPDTLTSIGDGAFKGCSALRSIPVPKSVTSIGEYAFYDCTSLQSLTFPSGVTEICDYVLARCGSLTAVIIQNGVTSIGNYAFNGCGSLEHVSIPSSVTSIGNYAFGYNIKYINYSGTAKKWNAIKKSKKWNYDMGKCIVYCSDQKITIGG